MSTGIVSIDLSRLGWRWPSAVLLVVAGAAWLGALARGEVLREVAGVPATCVLGARLAAGAPAAAWVLGGAGLALWCRCVPRTPRPARAGGSDLLPVVATQSVAVLGATLAHWLRVPCLLLLVAGVALYVRIIARFDLRQLLTGDGDQWVAGGALAISALACVTLAAVWHAPASLRIASIVLWVAALAWVPALLAGEAARPRLGTLPARWATVFPLGMYVAVGYGLSMLTGTG